MLDYKIFYRLDLDAIYSLGSRERAMQYIAYFPQLDYAIVDSCYGFINLHKSEIEETSS